MIEIVGEYPPAPDFGTIGAFPLLDNATVIRGFGDKGPAVIAAAPDLRSPCDDFSMYCVKVRNVEIRTSDDPAIGGIDLRHAQQCLIENVVINTGVYSVQASRPTHGTVGFTRRPATTRR